MLKNKLTLNSRSYAIQFDIAQRALLSIKKINDAENGGLYIQDILFTPQQLRMICYDNAFAALENFLEHIGF